MKDKRIAIILIFILLLSISSCKNKDRPNREYPDEDNDSQTDDNLNYQNNDNESHNNLSGNVRTISFGLNAPFSTKEIVRQVIPEFNDLGITKNRVWDDWGYREPSIDNYNWGGTDLRIDSSIDNDISVLLTIKPFGKTDGKINWYCDKSTIINENSCVFTSEGDEQFKEYLELLTKRYAGKIEKIQFSNEWDSTYHYSGTAQDYVKYANWLYDITKKNSPDTIVVLGSITKAAPNYIATCELGLLDEYTSLEGDTIKGDELQKQFCERQESVEKFERVKFVFKNARYEMADFHVYDDPENWDEYYTAMRTLTDKPLIISEFGGPNNFDIRFDASDEKYQAEELRKYITKIVDLGVLEAYYFHLVESEESSAPHHKYTGIIKIVDGKPVKKPNYEVFRELTRDW